MGNTINLAIAELAKLLKRSDKILNLNVPNDLSAPSMKKHFVEKSPASDINKTNTILHLENELDVPSNEEPNIITASSLQTHSNQPKNLRFYYQNQHKYNLRSSLNATHLIVQHVINDLNLLNHMHTSNKKRRL